MEIEDNSSIDTLNSQNQQIENNNVLDGYLEKLIITKRNFLTTQYKKDNRSQNNESMLSDNEEIREENIQEEDKSVSTNASIYEIIEKFSEEEDKPDDKDEDGYSNVNYTSYLRKIGSYFNHIKNFIIKHNIRLELRYVEYFFAIFVTNHVLKQEIKIVFKFFNCLVDVS